MNPWGAASQEGLALGGCPLDAGADYRFIVICDLVQLLAQRLRNGCSAHYGEALELFYIDHRHYPRHNGYAYACIPRSLHELEVVRNIKEKLRDEEIGACVYFALQIEKVGFFVWRFHVALRVGGRAQAKVVTLTNEFY